MATSPTSGPGGGGSFDGGTITTPLVAEMADPLDQAVELRPEAGATTGEVVQLAVYDDTGALIAFLDAAGGFRVGTSDGESRIQMQQNGTVRMVAGTAGGAAEVLVSSLDAVYVTLPSAGSLTVQDHSGNPLFKVDEATGALHGKTGQALTFDL